MLQMRSYIALAALLSAASVCAYALTQEGGPDVKLALAAYSASIAAYSAWCFNWREPAPKVIGAVPPSGDAGSKRLLTVYNDGALPTCLSVLTVSSRTHADRRYEFSRETFMLPGHTYLLVPITLAEGSPLVADRVHIQYVFYIGARHQKKSATVKWEGAKHASGT